MDAKAVQIDSPKLILLAHGSRDSNWCATFENGLEVINSGLRQDACLAYMEMASPSLEVVVARHFHEGCRNMAVLPLFFAAGRHLLHDIPAQIQKLEQELKGLRINLLDAVGLQEEFWTNMAQIIATLPVQELNPGNTIESARQ